MSARIILVALAAAAGIGSTPAAAQSASNDIRCLIVSNLFAKGAKQEKAKALASSARLFYGGRVSALPAGQIQAGMLEQQKQLTVASSGPTMNACARGMDEALKKIQNVGHKLK
jgi:hypothetical protein